MRDLFLKILPMLPIYVVNLKWSVKRREFIEKQLKRARLEYTIIEAYDAINDPDVNSQVIGNNREANLSRGHIGCVLSHLKIWNMMQDRKEKFALIIEDDVVISKKLREIIESVEPHLVENNVCFVSMQVHHPINFVKRQDLVHGYELCDVLGSIEGARGTQAYIISKTVAGRFTKELYPVKYNVDTWPLYRDKGYFENISVIFPFPVIHGEFLSDLHEESFKWQRSMKENVKFFVYKYKPTPIYQWFLKVRRKRVEKRQLENIAVNGRKVSKTYRF